MARNTTPAAVSQPAVLTKPRNEVSATLVARIEAGEQLKVGLGNNSASLKIAQETYKIWSDFNEEFLRRSFSNDEYAQGYRRSYSVGMIVSTRGPSFHEEVEKFLENLGKRIAFLKSLVMRLDLIDEAESVTKIESTTPPLSARAATIQPGARKVFIVHGRDEEAKAVVARFVEQCDLQPIILHEQADKGRTIIEKFEQESGVAFAIILLTPDDVGGLKPADGADPILADRARQNVVAEMGFFVGTLGRNRVCALRRGDVEVPSDFNGVIYTPFGPGDAWKMTLARELRAAGLDVDLNKALA